MTEETTYPSGPLTWLQEAVRTDRFELRRRIPLSSRDRRLQGVTLAIYAYKGRTPADPGAVLDMHNGRAPRDLPLDLPNPRCHHPGRGLCPCRRRD